MIQKERLHWLSNAFYNLTFQSLGESKTHLLLGTASQFQYTSPNYSRWVKNELKLQHYNCVRIGAVVPPAGPEDIISQNSSYIAIIVTGLVSLS